MNLADRIFAVGGAGKEIVFTLLEQDWVIESIIEPTLRNAEQGSKTVRVTIIDSADGSEYDEDLQRKRDIEERIAEIQEEARNADRGRPGDIQIDYKLLVDNISLNSQLDLVGEDAVTRITQGHGMDDEDWWLEEDHIEENLSFATGVVRRRALGKAIFFKAYSEDSEIGNYIDLPQTGSVAILTGLGGGTGSGIAIDLAKKLQEKQRTAEVSLFGVLPNPSEGDRESANAFAALSELEWLSLNNEGIFKDIVLLPITPTDYSGKMGDQARHSQMLKEFDEAIVYLLASYYNKEGTEDPLAHPPDFAPFTIGIPQILRYNVEAIEKSREAISDILENKREAVNAEQHVYESVERFMTKEYDLPANDTSISEVDRVDLEKRVEDMKKLLFEFELFAELEYRSREVFEDLINEAEEETDNINDLIGVLQGSVRTIDISGVADYKDDLDRSLAQVIKADIERIAKRRELLQLRQHIEEKVIRDVVDSVLSAGDNTVSGIIVQNLNNKKDDLEDRIEDLKGDIEETTAEIESIREENSDEIRRRFNRWETETDGPLRRLGNVQTPAVRDLAAELTRELQAYSDALANAESLEELEAVSETEVRRTVNELADVHDGIDAEFGGLQQRLEKSISDLRDARESQIKANQDTGILGSIAPFETSSEKEQEEAERNFTRKRNAIDDAEIYSVNTGIESLRCEVILDERTVVNRYTNHVDSLIKDIIDATEEILDTFEEELETDIDNHLSEDFNEQRVKDRLEEAIREDVGDTDEIEERRDELKTELSTTKEEKERYEAALELFEGSSPRTEKFSEARDTFRNLLNEQLERQDQSVIARNQDYDFIKEIQPVDVFKTTQGGDLVRSGLFNNETEAERVLENVRDLARNAREGRYTDMRRRKLSAGGQRYDHLSVNVGFISRAIDAVPNEALNLEQPVFADSFDLNPSGQGQDYVSWTHDSGGPWDIGLTVFIGGVFLDNIESVVRASGYRDQYENPSNRQTDELLHHVLGLEDGYYLRRSDLFNMEDDDDVEFYLDDPASITNQLKDKHIERIDFGTTDATDTPTDNSASEGTDD